MTTITVYTKEGSDELERNPTHNHDGRYIRGTDLDAAVTNALLTRIVPGPNVTIDSDEEEGTITIDASAGAPIPRVFKFSGASYVVAASEPAYFPQACRLSYGPAATLYPEPGEGDVQFTFETATNPAGPWTDRYGAIKPKIPSGDSYVVAPEPTSQAVAAGTWGRCRLISKTSGPVAALSSVIPVLGGDTTYNSGTASLGLHPGPAIPANGQPGDIVVMIIACNGASNVTLNPAFSYLSGNVSNATTPRAKVTVAMASYADGMAMSFETAVASPALAFAYLLRNTSPSNPVGDSNVPVGANGDTDGSISTPAGSATTDTDIVLAFAAAWYPATTIDYHFNASSGITELTDLVTNRTSASNYGLWVGSMGAVASGGAIPAKTLTMTGGTGATSTSYVTGYISFKRKSGTTGPTGLTVQFFVTRT